MISMNKKKNIKLLLAILVLFLIIIFFFFIVFYDRTQSSKQGDFDFNLIFKYGIGELNTYTGTFTKDMNQDPTITTNLTLSRDELNSIHQKMINISFFNYPTNCSGTSLMTPPIRYYFKVDYNNQIKEFWWDEGGSCDGVNEQQLNELIRLITDIIHSKEEFKNLPSPIVPEGRL